MQQQRRAPQLPKIEDDGNPRFVMFIRTANVYFWYPLNVVTGGTTAKIMLASKDNFLGKYIYKDTLARNLAAVIYKLSKKDELKTVVDKVKDFFGEVTTELLCADHRVCSQQGCRASRRGRREIPLKETKEAEVKVGPQDGGMILSLSTSGAVRQAKQDL
ncbi:protein HHL1, chloroplastic-like isoform X2 [Phragmites australis]|uniref:protein HHL1, chloroplastic-like isoform X2 n=1 Tax=Phragmites australis TaxID=29695 RepID=UPI002D77D6E3|nr:protein HHL1, chloroplastic-like isoform X2 [Phragmites australis]